MHARKNQQLYEQHLLLVVALRLDLNYVDLILLGGGHQDRGLDEQPTGKVRSEWKEYFDHDGRQGDDFLLVRRFAFFVRIFSLLYRFLRTKFRVNQL